MDTYKKKGGVGSIVTIATGAIIVVILGVIIGQVENGIVWNTTLGNTIGAYVGS